MSFFITHYRCIGTRWHASGKSFRVEINRVRVAVVSSFYVGTNERKKTTCKYFGQKFFFTRHETQTRWGLINSLRHSTLNAEINPLINPHLYTHCYMPRIICLSRVRFQQRMGRMRFSLHFISIVLTQRMNILWTYYCRVKSYYVNAIINHHLRRNIYSTILEGKRASVYQITTSLSLYHNYRNAMSGEQDCWLS